ncbi:hypothetical protein TCCBUS3UF1_21780 [Thermus sp. CCB_US3_UF1]|nr:hypothetical protein TCCBUS3UF1_21780 [Thermus sp. CCB_US3_UF1]
MIPADARENLALWGGNPPCIPGRVRREEETRQLAPSRPSRP